MSGTLVKLTENAIESSGYQALKNFRNQRRQPELNISIPNQLGQKRNLDVPVTKVQGELVGSQNLTSQERIESKKKKGPFKSEVAKEKFKKAIYLSGWGIGGNMDLAA